MSTWIAAIWTTIAALRIWDRSVIPRVYPGGLWDGEEGRRREELWSERKPRSLRAPLMYRGIAVPTRNGSRRLHSDRGPDSGAPIDCPGHPPNAVTPIVIVVCCAQKKRPVGTTSSESIAPCCRLGR